MTKTMRAKNPFKNHMGSYRRVSRERAAAMDIIGYNNIRAECAFYKINMKELHFAFTISKICGTDDPAPYRRQLVAKNGRDLIYGKNIQTSSENLYNHKLYDLED